MKHFVFTNFGIGIKDPRWIIYRLSIFEKTVSRSMRSQTTKNFSWTIFADKGLDKIFKCRLESILEDCLCEININYIESYAEIASNVSKIINEVSDDEVLITTRIDDDDLINIRGIEYIQLAAQENPADYLVCAFRTGYEYLATDGYVREINYESIALGLSIVIPAQKKKISVTNYAHHNILSTLELQGLCAIYQSLNDGNLSWLYTKHPISDSVYFGAKARIKNDPFKKRIQDIDTKEFGVDLNDLLLLGEILKDAPLGMPYKYLEKFSNIRNGKAPEYFNHVYSRFATRDNPSKSLRNGKKIRVAIIGSCVSRDLFDLEPELQDFFEIVFYSARSSVISYCSLPLTNKDIAINDDGFEGIRSQYDLHKTHFECFRASSPDVVLVDFIDERIGLIKHDGSYFSASGPLIKAFERSGVNFNITRPWNPAISLLRKWAAKAFMERINNVCQTIIVHKASWCKSYYDSRGGITFFPDEKWGRLIELNNCILNDVVAEIDSHWVPFDLIDVPYSLQHADANHKWGLSPFHYCANYYKQLSKLLLNRLSVE